MSPLFDPTNQSATLSRKERIAVQKAAFYSALAPIENAIRELGGGVTGTAWLNQTLRVRLPAGAIKQLADLEMIASLDTPRPIEIDGR